MKATIDLDTGAGTSTLAFAGITAFTYASGGVSGTARAGLSIPRADLEENLRQIHQWLDLVNGWFTPPVAPMLSYKFELTKDTNRALVGVDATIGGLAPPGVRIAAEWRVATNRVTFPPRSAFSLAWRDYGLFVLVFDRLRDEIAVY